MAVGSSNLLVRAPEQLVTDTDLLQDSVHKMMNDESVLIFLLWLPSWLFVLSCTLVD